MHEATLIYPHQLFAHSPALAQERRVYLVEEALLLTYNPIHTQKLMLHKLSMDAYQTQLEEAGYTVVRISIDDYSTTAEVFARIKDDGVQKLHIVDTTDRYLEQAIADADIERVWYESPLFILPKDEAIERYEKSKRFMARFYSHLRKDKNILIDVDGEPTGGSWSFDEDNRKKLPKKQSVPEDIVFTHSEDITAAAVWAEAVQAEKYGTPGCWLPYTHTDAEAFLHDFLQERFEHFGTYEDALTQRSKRLFHSTLSPLLNIGLLTPNQVLDAALSYAQTHNTPINSVEGFVRQILGWREFIRAAYELDGGHMRTQNFWDHTRTLPATFWQGTTDILPLDIAINGALETGYNHHIERLMVLGNFMLLTQTHPDEVYRWFMGMYLDAYDWVMVPNVYGMSQFADGGSFATKPYISGSNYLKKMSDYPAGDWEETWTALYWNFINTHQKFFTTNHRLSMMPRMLEKMDETKRTDHLKRATAYLTKHT